MFMFLLCHNGRGDTGTYLMYVTLPSLFTELKHQKNSFEQKKQIH